MNQNSYKYIPTIMRAVIEKRISGSIALKDSIAIPEGHPAQISGTIAHTPPTVTNNIIRNECSRFT